MHGAKSFVVQPSAKRGNGKKKKELGNVICSKKVKINGF